MEQLTKSEAKYLLNMVINQPVNNMKLGDVYRGINIEEDVREIIVKLENLSKKETTPTEDVV